ncbi:MAG: hypothetical protein ACK55I_15705, partial [bacterium]
MTEAESLQESSPGLEWRSHANPGWISDPSGRSERAREHLLWLSGALSERYGHAWYIPPGSPSQGWNARAFQAQR